MLSVQQITGGYSLHKPVIYDLQFQVEPSDWVGFIGPNGAGKSTTIKHILGLLLPQKGKITVNGHSLSSDANTYHSYFSYIPEKPQFYKELTLWEHIQLTAKAYQIPKSTFLRRATTLLEQFHMEKMRDWFPFTFSKGMQQKLMIICALLVETDYLIIDEPFIGLDPFAIRTLLQLLRERKEQGTGIFMSTHLLDLAEKHCDRLILLQRGRIAFQGTVSELKQASNQPQASLEQLFFQKVERG